MRRAQEMIDVGEGGLRQRAQSLARHLQRLFAEHALETQAVSDFPVRRIVLAEWKQRRVPIRRRRMGGDGGVHGGP
jgi:hypothetical protein